MKISMNRLLFILSITLMVVTGALIRTQTYGDDNITVKDLLGIWQQYSEVPWAIQFNKNGTFRAAHTVLRLEKAPMDEGRFQIEGTTLSFTSNDHCKGSCRGLSGSYNVALSKEGRLELIEQKDQCKERASYCDQYWIRIS